MDEKKCSECKTPIYGRVDKKFCSDQCRNTFNNRIHAISNKYIRKVNYIIRKNRFIMENLLGEKEVIKISKRKFQDYGFDFEYFTNIYNTKKGTTYIFCYEYGYQYIEDDLVIIVKKDDYLN